MMTASEARVKTASVTSKPSLEQRMITLIETSINQAVEDGNYFCYIKPLLDYSLHSISFGNITSRLIRDGYKIKIHKTLSGKASDGYIKISWKY